MRITEDPLHEYVSYFQSLAFKCYNAVNHKRLKHENDKTPTFHQLKLLPICEIYYLRHEILLFNILYPRWEARIAKPSWRAI